MRDMIDDECPWCAAADFVRLTGQHAESAPAWPPDDVSAMRLALVTEEYGELCQAFGDRDLPATVDAIADLVYVLAGMAAAMGVDMHQIFSAVHDANLRKLEGPVRADGKRLKPDGWTPPPIEEILAQQREVI